MNKCIIELTTEYDIHWDSNFILDSLKDAIYLQNVLIREAGPLTGATVKFRDTANTNLVDKSLLYNILGVKDQTEAISKLNSLMIDHRYHVRKKKKPLDKSQ